MAVWNLEFNESLLPLATSRQAFTHIYSHENVVLYPVDLTFVKDQLRFRDWTRPCLFVISLISAPIQRETVWLLLWRLCQRCKVIQVLAGWGDNSVKGLLCKCG